MNRAATLAAYLTEKNWMSQPVSAGQVSFLAAGEYNENWLVQCGGHAAVLRINHGSQLGLRNQSEYEFSVLRHVASSGLTPQPYALDPLPWKHGPGKGAMLMEYIPGTPPDYRLHAADAARLFARVHGCPLPPRGDMIAQPDPVRDIARESTGLLHRQPDHPRSDIRTRLLNYRDTVLRLADDTAQLFAGEPQVITNTEVNSGNFIVLPPQHPRRGNEQAGIALCLVDWEKAVISCCHQDLGHFLVPTTTRWKTDFTFDAQSRTDFLRAYLQARHGSVDADALEALHLRTRVLERTILLRALSWCFMAWYEYSRGDRTLRNEFTYGRITSYLENIECILKYGE
ncbi:aminoglycoside phosphotransferase family protein [Oleidesulfovibrio alaskensis]|uniref:aminoglycoside phosphotransferase family protein n=1 Tax=Oleidesulfovibrio alaskensis TaxID=58180 RepID=UPI000405B531|nr:aminoglycoside phosphotransferase family protein [Oleidesulfovibrio alaskensis]